MNASVLFFAANWTRGYLYTDGTAANGGKHPTPATRFSPQDYARSAPYALRLAQPEQCAEPRNVAGKIGTQCHNARDSELRGRMPSPLMAGHRTCPANLCERSELINKNALRECTHEALCHHRWQILRREATH